MGDQGLIVLGRAKNLIQGHSMDSILEIAISNAVTATLLAVVVFAAQRFIRRPALVHCLWLLVLLKLVTPPLIPIRVPTTTIQGFLDGRLGFLMHQPLSNTVAILLAIWGLGTVVFVLVVSRRVIRFQKFLQFGTPANPELQSEVARLSRQIGLSDPPMVWLVPGPVSPMLWSFAGRTRILFPTELLAQLDAGATTSLLLHELAHLKRRDHWVRYLELLVTGLYWWHPVVWWSRRELHIAEEECCDARVVSQMPSGQKSYVDALLVTIDFMSRRRLAMAPVASGIGSANSLRRRMALIMRGSVPSGLTKRCRLAVLATAVGVLPFWPSWTHSEPRLPRQNAVLIARAAGTLVAIEDTGFAARDGLSFTEYEPNEIHAYLSAINNNTPPGEITARAIPQIQSHVVVNFPGRIRLSTSR